MDLNKLDDKFSMFDIEWRIGRCGVANNKPWGMALAYINNRAIQNRLDTVCGKENWKNEFKEWHGDSQICGISIKINNDWVTKWDGADKTGYEGTKGGLSDSMKRAGYQWGIGRYLYELPETWINCSLEKNKEWNYQPAKIGKDGKITRPAFYWETPALPNWALPIDEKKNAKPKELQNKAPQFIKDPEDILLETSQKLKELVTDKYWEDAKTVIKESYPGESKLSDIMIKYGKEIIKDIKTKGVKPYLGHLPF